MYVYFLCVLQAGSLTISIKRRLLRHPRVGLATPTSEDPKSRVKKLLARFGGGGATTPTGMTGTLAATTPPVHTPSSSSPINPRKRELDMTELGFPGPNPAKRFHMDPQVSATV